MKKVLVFFIVGFVFFGACSNKQTVVGTWTDVEGITWIFNADGKLAYSNRPGDSREYQYGVTDTKLSILGVGYGTWVRYYHDQTYDISFSPDGKTLVLTGGRNLDGWNTAGPGMSSNQLTRQSKPVVKTALKKKDVLDGTTWKAVRGNGEIIYKFSYPNYSLTRLDSTIVTGLYSVNGKNVTMTQLNNLDTKINGTIANNKLSVSVGGSDPVIFTKQ